MGYSDSKNPALLLKSNQFWFAIFAIWFLILSGIFSQTTRSPGLLQLMRLKSLLHTKEQKLQKTEAQIEELVTERDRLKHDVKTQEREIRNTLGYVARDEIVFEFSSSMRKSDLNQKPSTGSR